jgi:hypothetical protein
VRGPAWPATVRGPAWAPAALIPSLTSSLANQRKAEVASEAELGRLSLEHDHEDFLLPALAV